MAEIELVGRGGVVRGVAQVDDELYGWVTCNGPWHLQTRGYAARTHHESTGAKRMVLMHRMILGLGPGHPLQVDHINGDKLDNRRSNLRAVTHQQNLQNRGGMPGSASRYRNVAWETQTQKWRVMVGSTDKRISLGRFDDELEAALAADAWRAEHWPFAPRDPALP